MFHLSPKTGEVAPCGAASPETCPYGADEHFSTREAGEASLHSRFGADALRGTRADPTSVWRNTAARLRQEGNSELARAEWLETSVTYALDPAGRSHFEEILEQGNPGSSRHAFAEYVLHEANLRRVSSAPMEDLLSLTGDESHARAQDSGSGGILDALRNVVAKRGGSEPRESPFRWTDFPSNAIWPQSRRTSDYVQAQKAADALFASPSTASKADLSSALVSMRHHSDLWVQMPPLVPSKDWSGNAKYSMDPEEWAEKAKSARTYSEDLARAVVSHPKATADHRRAVEAVHGKDFVVEHSVMSREEMEDYLARELFSEGNLSPVVAKAARDQRFQSNRLALLLAVKDTDSFQRQEAFHQVVMSGMETFTEEERLWMANNMEKLPTSEGTVATLKGSLVAWARGHADQEERESLLALLEEKPKRRFFSRD